MKIQIVDLTSIKLVAGLSVVAMLAACTGDDKAGIAPDWHRRIIKSVATGLEATPNSMINAQLSLVLTTGLSLESAVIE